MHFSSFFWGGGGVGDGAGEKGRGPGQKRGIMWSLLSYSLPTAHVLPLGRL